MKTVMVALLVSLFAVSAFACDGHNKDKNPTTNPPTQTSK